MFNTEEPPVSGSSLDAFLADIDGQTSEPLDRETERELVRRMNEEGDEDARAKLIQSNLRYALYEAKRFRRLDLPYEDVISAAIEGLIGVAPAWWTVYLLDLKGGHHAEDTRAVPGGVPPNVIR